MHSNWIKNHIAALKSLYDYLWYIDTRTGNIKNITTIRKKPVAKKIIYDKDILDDLSDDIWWLRSKVIIAIWLYTGCRIAEIMNINIKHILTPKYLSITTKNKKNNRIYISPMLSEIAKKYYIERKLYLLQRYGYTEKGSSLLVSHSNNNYGQPLWYDGVKESFEKLSIDIWSHIRPHNLRHSFASKLYDKWISIYDIQQLLWHKYLNTTSDYITIKDSKLLESSRVLDQPSKPRYSR